MKPFCEGNLGIDKQTFYSFLGYWLVSYFVCSNFHFRFTSKTKRNEKLKVVNVNIDLFPETCVS